MLKNASALKPGVRVELRGSTVSPITVVSAPTLGAGAAGQTLDALVAWGVYTAPSGETLNPPVREMRLDGGSWVAFVGATVLEEGGTYQVRELVGTVQGTSGTFGSQQITVEYIQPTAENALPDIGLTVDPSTFDIPTAGDFDGTDLTYTLQSPPSGVAIASNTGVVTIDRSAETSGAIVVRATTPDGKFVDSAFNLTVLVGQITADPVIASARFYNQQQLDTNSDYSANTTLGRFTSNVGAIDAAVYREDGVNLSPTDNVSQDGVIDLRVTDDVGTEALFPIEDAVEYRAQVSVSGPDIISDINDIVPGSESITKTVSGGTPYDGAYTKTAAEWRVLGHFDDTISVSAPGSPVVGDTVTVTDRGGWHYPDGRSLSLMVQWLRDGAPISGATGLSYDLVTADIGTNVAPQITASDGVTQLDVVGPATAVQGGTIFIQLSGQSQLREHEPKSPNPETYPGLKMWKNGQIIDAVSPLENGVDGNTGVNMGLKTAQLLAAADPGNEYIVVGTIKGGTGLDNEWATGGTWYNNAIAEMQAAMVQRPGATLGYMIGAHGGAAAGQLDTDQFRTALATFRTDFCAALGFAEPPMLNGTVYRSTVAIELLNDGIKTVYEAADRFWAVDWRDGLTDIGDGTHLNQAGMLLAAARNVQAFGQTTSLAQVLAETNGDLSFTWPAQTATDDGGTYNLYNPTGGRRPVSNVVEYTVNGGAPQTTTIPYGDPLTVPQSSLDDMTARVRVQYQDATFSPFSNTVVWTVPAAFNAQYVGTTNVPDNYDAPNPQLFTINVPAAAQAGDDVIIVLVNRTANGNDSSISSVLINGDGAAPVHNDRNDGNALALVSHTLSAGDITAGTISVSFVSATGSLRSQVAGVVYRGGSLTVSPQAIDIVPTSSNNTFSLTRGFPIGALHVKSSNSPLTVTGDANITLTNGPIEGVSQNVMTAVAASVDVTTSATINMNGLASTADATGVLAWYG